MAKETRVGLLVGLLFIIMFGLVLGELTSSSGKAPTAPVAEINTSAFTATPAIDDFRTPILQPRSPGDGSPLAPIGGADTGIADARYTGPRDGGVAIARVLGEEAPARSVALEASTPPAGMTAGRELPPPREAVAPAAAGPRTYKIQPNDSLIRIARKVYGPGKDDLYKLIYKANRDRLTDEATLSVGQELVIPPLPADAGSPGGPAAGREARPPASVPPAPAPASPRRPGGEMDLGGGEGRFVEMDMDRLRRHLGGSAPAPAGTPSRMYVVQRGDSLSGIARRFLQDDSAAAVRRIFEANRDRLASPDRLQVGMKLQIPS